MRRLGLAVLVWAVAWYALAWAVLRRRPERDPDYDRQPYD